MRTDRIDFSGHAIRYNDNYLYYTYDPYNPLNLPAFTVRLLMVDGWQPVSQTYFTQVSENPNVWDFTKANTSWGNLGLYSNLLEILGANTTGIVSMVRTFQNCSNLRYVAPFDMSTVTDAFGLFDGAISLTAAPNLNLRNVNRIAEMYAHCRSLTTVPTIDLYGVTDAHGIFCMGEYTITNYKSHPNNVLQSVSFINGDDMWYGSEMFSCCTALTSITGLEDCPFQATNFMFDDCTSLVNIPDIDLSRVYNTSAMFRDCTSIAEVPDYDVSAVTSTGGMFRNCTNVQSGALSLYNKLSQNTYSDENMYAGCFENCGSNTASGQAELAQIPTSWGGTMA